MYILYGGKFTRALLTEQVLLESDVPYDLRAVDIVNNEHKTDRYLAINPAGWVPALVTPTGETLYETPAINLYIVDHHAIRHLAPSVLEPDRGQFLSGLFYLHGELEPTLKRYFYPHRFVARDADTSKIKEMAREAAYERLSVIDERLSKAGPYHLGERFSLVDLVMAFWTTQIDFNDTLRNVKRCQDLVVTRPKIQHKFEEGKAWRDEYIALQARGEGVR